jgi:hypothetical protein
MVKNLPTVERSTKIRFGKNAMDDQGENTIVFNASDEQIDTSQPGSVYITPLRQVLDISDRDNKILTYNRDTKEMSDSGVAAVDVLQPNLQATTNLGNTTTNTIEFRNTVTSLVTTANVGIANSLASHTLSIGSNLYVDDTGSNVLVVNGDTNIKGDIVIQGNAQIDGVITVIDTENLTIGDAIIELGRNNTVGDTTLDLGLIMNRPGSNVTVGFLEGVDELALAYTETSADSKTITPLTSETLDVHVYGRVLTESNVGIMNTSPIHTLDVGSNLFVDEYGSNVLVVSGNTSISGDLTVDEDTLHVDSVNKSVGIETVNPSANLHVVGNVYVSSNLTVDDDTFHVDAVNKSVGIKTTSPDAELHVVGNVYVSSNLTVDTDTFHVDVKNKSVGIETVNPDANLHVVGNVYVSSNLTVDGDTLHVDVENKSVGIETKNPDANLHVVGNVYISSNLTVDTDTLHVDVKNKSVGIETKNPDANLHVVGNTYISEDLTVATNTLHVESSVERVGIKTKTPDAELHVVGNVYVGSNLTVDTDTFHVDVENKSVGIETVNPDANLHVVGNVYVSSNLTVDGDTLHVDVEADHVGINTKNPNAELHVVGNAYVSSNLTVDGDTLHVDVEADHVGINTKNPNAELHVIGNVYVSSNLTVDEDTLHVDTTTNSVGIETKSPQANLHVVGNVYVSSNLTVDEDTLHVDAVEKSIGLGTVNPTSNLHVVGNAYVSSNTTTDGTLTLNHPTTAILTDLNSNVEVKLNQLANVVIDTTSLANEDMLVYDGSNWVNQLQNHTFLYAKAEETISKGDAVYASGNVGNNTFLIRKAQANSSATMPALGVAYQDFALNQEGLIVTFGRADGINTDNFQTGETVYVSNVTAGALSNVKPYGATDLIQNIGLVVKGHPSTGIVSVTGVGRSNDIPNAPVVADEGDINYVYVNDANNDLKKILPTNLLTQLQTLQQVTDTGNTTSNTIQFTDVTTGLVTVSNVEVGSNISVAGLIDAVNKHVPMVGTDGFLEKSPIYFTPGGTYVVSAAEAEFLGNLTLSGNTTILNSESVTISDRIFGVAANNSASGLDSGFMIEHQEGDPLEYANVALIYHADEHRLSISYTQNTFTDNHILHYEDETHQMLIDLRGNVQIQNNTTIGETLDVTGVVTFADDLTVGAASNLFVDVSTSRVGINEASPGASLDVGGDVRVQDTTDSASVTTGALVVSGGLGVASNIHSTNVYAASHVGVGTDAATAPIHLLVSGTGETTNGIYMKSAAGSATNDAIVNLEVAADGGDAFMTWNASGGAAFAMGLDRSENLLTIANSSSDLTTNQLLHMTTAGVTTIENTTNSTSKTTGALVVVGGVGISGDIHATHANLEDVEADSVNITDTTTSTSTTTGALKVAGGVSTQEKLNVGGVTKIWDSTAVTGKTDGALVVVGGVGISGDIHATHANLEDVEADSVNITDTTTSTSTTTGALKVAGGVSTQEKLNVGGVTKVWDSTAVTGKTDGALVVVGGVGISGDIHATHANLEDVEADSVNITDTTAATDKTTGSLIVAGGVGVSGALYGAAATFDGITSITNSTAATSKTDGALVVTGGVGISGALHGSTADLDGVVTLTDTTEATSSTTGALKAAGGVGIAKDVYVGEQAYITGGLITNTGGVTKKTYSFSGDLTNAQTIANSTIKITFSAHVFYAKIVAHLVESDDEVSTLSMECGGGHRTGGTPLTIAKGPTSVFGSASTNPWNSAVAVTTTTVALAPTTDMAAAGNYNIFIEYISAHASGAVTKITEGSTDVITFGY